MRIAILSLLSMLAAMTMAQQSARVNVKVNTHEVISHVPADYTGLSYETKNLLPDADGHRYFDASNQNLVQVFRTLGIQSLRIGGNSVDAGNNPPPSLQDVDQLFAFARAAGVKVIYTVRLNQGDAADAARTIGHIRQHYPDLLDCVSIGNEPEGYYRDLEQQLGPHWSEIYEAIKAVAPDVRICGPDDNPRPAQFKYMLSHFGAPSGGPLQMLSMHTYPGDCAYRNPFRRAPGEPLIPCDAAQKREQLLAPHMHHAYDSIYQRMSETIGQFPFRLTECNSIWYGGLLDASDTYASALWGLDFMYWWSTHQCLGTNFHTGDRVGGGDGVVVSRYATFVTEGQGYDIRPLSYAVKLFNLGRADQLYATSVNGEPVQLYAYATGSGSDLYVTLINMTHDTQATTADVVLDLDRKLARRAECISMEAPGADISLHHGITIGGSSISPEGNWQGVWSPLKTNGRQVRLSVPAASAVVLHLTTR